MAEEFRERRLRGAEFWHVDLRDATFEEVTFAGARMRRVDLTGLSVRSALVRDAEIRADIASLALHGEVQSLTVNGVEVMHLVARSLPTSTMNDSLAPPSRSTGRVGHLRSSFR